MSSNSNGLSITLKEFRNLPGDDKLDVLFQNTDAHNKRFAKKLDELKSCITKKNEEFEEKINALQTRVVQISIVLGVIAVAVGVGKYFSFL